MTYMALIGSYNGIMVGSLEAGYIGIIEDPHDI